MNSPSSAFSASSAVNPLGPRGGRLVVIYGCMFAGKTARLIARLAQARAAGRRVVACKHRLDDRYDLARLITHDGRACAAVPVSGAGEVLRAAAHAQVVGIDEAQFFGRSLVRVCLELRAGGRTVVVAGIDHDAWGQPFPPLPQLSARADELEQMDAPCAVCGRPAVFSQRMVPVIDGRLVGGPGEYEPRCPAHFTPLASPAPVY